MSKLLKVAALLSCSLGCASALQAADSLPDTKVAQAQALASEFIGQLKPQLKEAMTSGGPGNAIEVCASVAPAIAESLTASSGWTVKRVSLNARNASRATPDAWERQVLEQFDLRQAAGEAPADLHYSQEVNGQFRYLQAQGVEHLGVAFLEEGVALRRAGVPVSLKELMDLLAGLQQQLFTLLARLLTQFGHLPLSLLADGGVVDQLVPLPLAGGNECLRVNRCGAVREREEKQRNIPGRQRDRVGIDKRHPTIDAPDRGHHGREGLSRVRA